jgi:hypothetical protein
MNAMQQRLDELAMRLGSRLSLDADHSVLPWRQRPLAVLNDLPKGAAAVAAFRVRSNVQVGIDVQDAALYSGMDVAQVMAERGLMAAAQDDGYGLQQKQSFNHETEVLLHLFERCLNANVAQVEESNRGEVDWPLAGAVPTGEAIELLANGARRGSRAGPAMIAAHTFIAWEAQQHGLSGTDLARLAVPALDHVAQARVITVGGMEE